MSSTVTKGRPRDPQVDAAIVAAALDVLADRGFARFTVEEVATVAGVGKASIYRRFADKDALVAHALDHVNDDLPAIPDDGNAKDRLAIMMERVRRGVPDSHAGRIMQHVRGESGESPHLLTEFYRRVIEPRRNRIRSVLVEGKTAGEFASDFDVEVAITALVGSMLYLSIWAGCEGADDTSTRDVVDLVLN